MDLSILFKILIIVVSVLVGVGSTLLFKMKQDNPIEEISEEVIKEETGVDVDLSPSSPEIKVSDVKDE